MWAKEKGLNSRGARKYMKIISNVLIDSVFIDDH